MEGWERFFPLSLNQGQKLTVHVSVPQTSQKDSLSLE